MVLRMIMAAGCVISSPALAQEPDPESRGSIEGEWAGAVALPGGEFRFSVTFEQADGVLSATMDIPAQGEVGLPLIAVSYVDGRVHFELDGPIRGLAVWDGAHEGDMIEGEFKQGALTTTFSVSRADAGEPEAEEPIAYGVEEVSFENGEIHLEGTLTLPEGTGAVPGRGPDHGVGASGSGWGRIRFPPLPGPFRLSHAAGDRGLPLRADNIDYHIQLHHAFYSVPHPLARHQVDVRISAHTVEVFHKSRRVAAHRRVHTKGGYSTEPAHMPAAHRAHAEWSASRLIRSRRLPVPSETPRRTCR